MIIFARAWQSALLFRMLLWMSPEPGRLSSAPCPNSFSNEDIFEAGINVEAHVAKDAYLLAGYSPSALMLEWFRDNYGFEEKEIENKTGKPDWDSLMEKAAKAPCGSNGVFFLPHLAGAGTPDIDSRSLGRLHRVEYHNG